ncbi:hypothetical protein ACOMHN_030030 [Nucella lapillus]
MKEARTDPHTSSPVIDKRLQLLHKVHYGLVVSTSQAAASPRPGMSSRSAPPAIRPSALTLFPRIVRDWNRPPLKTTPVTTQAS